MKEEVITRESQRKPVDRGDRKAAGCAAFLTNPISQQEVFTPEDLTAEHRDIAAAVADFVKVELIDRGEEVEVLNYELSRSLVKKCGSLGFLGLDVEEKYGGMELDAISVAAALEQIGYGDTSFTSTMMVQTGIGSLPLYLFGTEAQKKKYFPGLLSGDLVGCFALTEPQAGSDALNSLCKATLSEDGRHYILNGVKQFITNSGFADIAFVFAKVDGKYLTAFIVETQWEGFYADEEESKMGMHGSSTKPLRFENVKVPVENVLGEIGKGHLVALNTLNMGRYKAGPTCLGTSKRGFSEAVKYAKQRVQFGKPICEFGLIKEKISEMAIKIYAVESMVYRTAGLIQTEIERRRARSSDPHLLEAKVLQDHIVECCINKAYGTEVEDYVNDEELQIFGGYGFIKGHHPELAYRNHRINRIWEGTNEINRLAVAHAILGQAADGQFDLMFNFQRASAEIEGVQSVTLDQLESLNAEAKLLQTAKNIALYVLGKAHRKYGAKLREEEEILGIVANIVIEIYAMESALLRSQKILAKKPERGVLPVLMTKVLMYDSIERVGVLARKALEDVSEAEMLEDDIKTIRRVAVPPIANTVAYRKLIANSNIEAGRYFV